MYSRGQQKTDGSDRTVIHIMLGKIFDLHLLREAIKDMGIGKNSWFPGKNEGTE